MQNRDRKTAKKQPFSKNIQQRWTNIVTATITAVENTLENQSKITMSIKRSMNYLSFKKPVKLQPLSKDEKEKEDLHMKRNKVITKVHIIKIITKIQIIMLIKKN